MTPKDYRQIAWLAVFAVLVCGQSAAQKVQRAEQVKPIAPQGIATQLPRNPYAMTSRQRHATMAQLNPAQRVELSRLAKSIASGQNASSINNQWAGLFESVHTENPGTDANALIMLVMHDSYEGTQRELEEFARRVQDQEDKKKQLRSQILDVRARRADELQQSARITALEEELASVGDDAQVANLDLQNKLQQLQHTLQTMSSVSKMLHDTAMAIIRKKIG